MNYLPNCEKKYFEFFKVMMDNKAPISDSLLEQKAKEVGMDVAKAKQDAGSSEVLMQIERNRALASNMQIHGTPAFVISARPAPFPPSVSFMSLLPSALPPPKK